jgi:homoserine dehydrogenase
VLGGRGPVESSYAALRVLPETAARTRYQLRLEVADRPGVLAQVAAVLAGQGVSIEAVRQSPKPDGIGAESATLVITTHVTTELALRVTAEALGSLDVVRRVVSVLRVEGA